MQQLLEAIRNDDRTTVRTILGREPALARRPQAMLEAARFARAAVLEALLEAGADANASWRNYRPIHAVIQAEAHAERSAAPAEQMACIDALLAGGVDLELAGSWLNLRPLLLAAFAGERVIAAHLLASGAHEDAFTDAALGARAALAQRLARDATLAQARDASTFTPLACAAAGRLGLEDQRTADELLAIAAQLVDLGADPNAEVREVRHLLPVCYFAIGSRQRALLELLLTRGADPTRALAASFFRDSFEWAELALAHGARIDEALHDGRPVLLETIRWGRVADTLWLLDHGADPNVRDANGWTALHQAASRGNKRMLEAVLAAGANAGAKDHAGLTPLDVARARGRRDLAAVLEHAS